MKENGCFFFLRKKVIIFFLQCRLTIQSICFDCILMLYIFLGAADVEKKKNLKLSVLYAASPFPEARSDYLKRSHYDLFNLCLFLLSFCTFCFGSEKETSYSL